ncbi:hypothetical protein ABB30_07265 [Stenotrophomonas ginsengisoli]|uniref:Uncharacterized protein n=1 Tax=Stenotrophomonas ginsengisoli TaxID=336566 RepID=A0A0R0DHH3_9GAMM|nr:hypothetical protein [Stenotrophomonas ginsengisoli]KRG77300.1 hypothetical protein ABB30_07265 [Stenotrophomonas ginsengisoli]
MRPLLHPLQRLTIAHHALIWLLLMIGMASLAPPLAAQPHTGPACSQALTPDTPQPGPDPQLYIELLAESGNAQAEHACPAHCLPGRCSALPLFCNWPSLPADCTYPIPCLAATRPMHRHAPDRSSGRLAGPVYL